MKILKNDGPPPVEEKEAGSPFVREFFLVQGIGFRGIAYCNREGKWHEAFHHLEWPDDIRVLG
jgi:hypothetical protein